jgi:hypothetical protein
MATGETSNTIYDIATNAWVPIEQFSTTEFRSAKIFVQGSSVNEHQTSELFVIHDNNLVYLREVYLIYTQDPFITFSGEIVDNSVRILANTSLPNTDIVLYGIMLEVANKSLSDSTISQDKILEAAASMRGLYPEDETDYIQLQAGSLYRENLVAELDREVNDTLVILNSPEFLALSVPEKQARMEELTAVINERSAALQSSIDSDIEAFQDISTKVESGSIVSGISSSYSDPYAKSLLDLTLNSEMKAILNPDEEA